MTWRFVRFGLLVTGECEQRALPDLFRSLMQECACQFEVIARVRQLDPVTSLKGSQRQRRKGGELSRRDEEIGLRARNWLNRHPDGFLLLIDDVESDRRPRIRAVFERYQAAIQTLLIDRAGRASVQFLANMLEAYCFGDVDATNAVLGTTIAAATNCVEQIRNPKRELQKISSYRETTDGPAILRRLDARTVLGDHTTCPFLRSTFAWCWKALGRAPGAEYRLQDGIHSHITGPQLASLPEPEPDNPGGSDDD